QSRLAARARRRFQFPLGRDQVGWEISVYVSVLNRLWLYRHWSKGDKMKMIFKLFFLLSCLLIAVVQQTSGWGAAEKVIGQKGAHSSSATAPAAIAEQKQANNASVDFPMSTATPSEECGVCHEAIYREFALGFGADLKYPRIVYQSREEKLLTLPANVSATATAHSLAGIDPFPIHAREVEEEGRSCNVCHFPEAFEIPDINKPDIIKPTPRPKGQEIGGLTCASCHLTPEGKIRGPNNGDAPQQTVQDPKMQTSAMCAYCHSLGQRVVGKQTQTFLEWRDDFHNPRLGSQSCQDCHMSRTVRKSAEAFDVPARA